MPKITWADYNPERLKDVIKARLAENMEDAGKFVETRARSNLLAITDPEWGAGYRRAVVARRLTYVVEVLPNEVVLAVGVRASQSGEQHGYWIEIGSKRAPAHPYLRPAVFNHARDIVELIGG